MCCSQTLVSELPLGSGHFLALHSVYQPLYQNPSSKPFLSVVMGVPPSGLRCCCRETGVPRDVCRTRPGFSVVGHQPHGLFPCEGEGKTSAMEALIRLLCLFFKLQNPCPFSEGCMPNQSLQSCPTLCNPMDPSPPGSSVHGILQARILEWFTMSSSRGSSQPRGRTHDSTDSCQSSL